MLRTLLAAAIVVVSTSGGQSLAQTLFRPVAVVNDSAITGFDLAQRAQILVALGFSAASADALRNEALDQLVEDRLKLQAGKRLGIRQQSSMIESGIEQIAARSNLSAPEFQALMNAQGITDQAIEDLAVAETIWIQVVRARFAGRVEPGEAEIDSELAAMGQLGGDEFRILEIGLPAEDANRTEAETFALAGRLSVELNTGGDFEAAVARYSRAPSSTRGGDVGWVPAQRMPTNLLTALSSLEIGEVSEPLSVAGGYSIVKLVAKRNSGPAGGENPELREQIRRRLTNIQSARLADGLLQELRRDALIEVR